MADASTEAHPGHLTMFPCPQCDREWPTWPDALACCTGDDL